MPEPELDAVEDEVPAGCPFLESVTASDAAAGGVVVGADAGFAAAL